MDMQIQEQLKVVKAAAAELAGEASETESTITVREALEELAKVDGLPAHPKAVLDTILKLAAFEQNTTVKVTVRNDPAQQTPTSSTGTIQALTVASGDSAVAANLKLVAKKIDDAGGELVKMVEGNKGAFAVALREAIEKAGPATAKLEQIKQVLAIKIDDNEDTDWKLRSRVGELVSMLAQHAAIERMLDSAPVAASKAASPSGDVWPADMARAAFDQDAKAFKPTDPFWGRDTAQ